MAVVTPRQSTVTGVNANLQAASAGGDEFLAGDRNGFIVVNGSGSSVTVTVATPRSGPGGTAIADIATAVPAGQTWIFGPYNRSDFGDATNSRVAVTWSATTSVTWAPVSI